MSRHEGPDAGARQAPGTSWPLWPLALTAGLLPAVASIVAWSISLHGGFVPSCNPFLDGCTSISRAARVGPATPVFRALVLPAAALQAVVWLLQAQALRDWGRADGNPGRSPAALASIGLAAGIALVCYGAFLGTEGEAYRWLRRYGTVVYFGGTCLAMLILGRALQRLRAAGEFELPRAHERALVGLFAAIVALGVVNAFAGAWAEPELADRVENATEWWGSLGLTAAFVVIASLWRRWRLRARLTFSPSVRAIPPDR